jgi:hypothetical protein
VADRSLLWKQPLVTWWIIFIRLHFTVVLHSLAFFDIIRHVSAENFWLNVVMLMSFYNFLFFSFFPWSKWNRDSVRIIQFPVTHIAHTFWFLISHFYFLWPLSSSFIVVPFAFHYRRSFRLLMTHSETHRTWIMHYFKTSVVVWGMKKIK